MKLNAYLNPRKDEKQNIKVVDTYIKEKDGVKAAYIRGNASFRLDPDFGAGIDFEINDVESWMSDNRHCQCWCRPEFGTSFKTLPKNTQGLVCKKKDGTFAVVLPVVSEEYRCVLNATSEDNMVTARLYSGYDSLFECEALAFTYAEGKNPFRLLEDCTKYALELLNNGCRTRKERRYPEIMEYLGWCTWDALEMRCNEKDLLKKCEEFKEKKIPVRWTILDDMWGDVAQLRGRDYETVHERGSLQFSSKLWSFKAAPERFPNGLSGCIKKMKEYGMKIGMWHPTTGYWKGIDPKGEIYRDHKDCLVQTPAGIYMHDYEQKKAYEYYSACHDYYVECGAEFVKIDLQSMIEGYYRNRAPLGKVAREYHKAMEASVGQHFDNTMINCMGMDSWDMWNRSFSPISRCSGDFLPENEASFSNHLMQCAYNDLIQGQFYYCDWDMWWTDDSTGLKHSIMRAISGGPIYVSDKLDRSIRELVMPLCFEDGRILRCDNPGYPTVDCLTEDPRKNGKIFKIYNMSNGSGVMTVFNLDENNGAVSGTISPSDIDGLEGEEFAVYEHFSKTMQIVKYDEKIEINYKDRNEFGVYIFVPIKDGFAPIGRTDKFISPASIKAVVGKEIELIENGEYAYVLDGKLHIENK